MTDDKVGVEELQANHRKKSKRLKEIRSMRRKSF